MENICLRKKSARPSEWREIHHELYHEDEGNHHDPNGEALAHKYAVGLGNPPGRLEGIEKNERPVEKQFQ